jgi:hypothetical protein
MVTKRSFSWAIPTSNDSHELALENSVPFRFLLDAGADADLPSWSRKRNEVFSSGWQQGLRIMRGKGVRHRYPKVPVCELNLEGA